MLLATAIFCAGTPLFVEAQTNIEIYATDVTYTWVQEGDWQYTVRITYVYIIATGEIVSTSVEITAITRNHLA